MAARSRVVASGAAPGRVERLVAGVSDTSVSGPGGTKTGMTCVSCRTGLDHCHGTVLVHVDGGVECTEPDCVDAVLLRHTLVIRCDQVEGGCDCVIYGELGLAS